MLQSFYFLPIVILIHDKSKKSCKFHFISWKIHVNKFLYYGKTGFLTKLSVYIYIIELGRIQETVQRTLKNLFSTDLYINAIRIVYLYINL